MFGKWRNSAMIEWNNRMLLLRNSRSCLCRNDVIWDFGALKNCFYLYGDSWMCRVGKKIAPTSREALLLDSTNSNGKNDVEIFIAADKRNSCFFFGRVRDFFLQCLFMIIARSFFATWKIIIFGENRDDLKNWNKVISPGSGPSKFKFFHRVFS